MGQRKSKPGKTSYNVTPIVSENEIQFVRGEPEPETRAASPDIVPKTPHVADITLVPAWVNEDRFSEILKENVEGFEKITKFVASPAMAPGENYATLMLQVSIDFELRDKTTQTMSFMLKVAHDTEHMRQLMGVMDFFALESSMYFDVIPELEQMYRDVGLNMGIGPKAYRFKEDLGHKNILMEDLRPHGFKNANRLECLNMEHTKCVLRKLAAFHAASACRVDTKGPYSNMIMNGMLGENSRAMMESMFSSFSTSFMQHLKSYKDGEIYYNDFESSMSTMIDEFLLITTHDPNEFNVLNHGDFWCNNILFKYDKDNNVEETYFVDFQTSQWGSPARDLHYFIISSVNIEIKLKQFDYLIRYYYDNLVEFLHILKYSKRVPTLRDLHMQLVKYGTWALSTATGTLAVVLLDPTETANIENFLGDSQDGMEFRNLMYTNQRYRRYIEEILPWLHNRGFLVPLFSRTAEETNADSAVVAASSVDTKKIPVDGVKTNLAPEWVDEDHFIGILQRNVEGFKAIKSFSVAPATKGGDNYASLMLKVNIEAELEGGDSKALSYMLKVAPAGEQAQAMLNLFQTFKKETLVYNEVLPRFESIYKEAGLHVTFGPRSYRFEKDPGCDNIVLENLRPLGFQNADRLSGLDMDHTKNILDKLAQFHAVSAYNVVVNGPYNECLLRGMFCKENRALMEKLGESFFEQFMESLKSFNGSEEYLDKINLENMEKMYDVMEFLNDVNPDRFNVLNHGDCWTNNVMFQYDDDGKIEQTYFVDFQMVKYGSPAQDLYYFLLSSPSLDIKIDQFDYFIRFYHEKLQHYLEFLKYPNKIPTLKELHQDLLDYGGWGLTTVNGVMPAVLLDPSDDASMENLLNDNENSKELRKNMYSHDRYHKHAEKILAWLNKRGLLDLNVPTTLSSEKVVTPASLVPAWIDEEHFIDIVRERVTDFAKLVNISAVPATKAGDNYASIILRVEVDVELNDGSREVVTFMLKILPEDGSIVDMWNFFPKENKMYNEYLPAFEKMYKDCGKELTFAPRMYKFTKDPGCDTVLMEDLRPRGFRNANRLEGLDLEHTKSVLRKMAQLHAASVKWVELNGPFLEIFTEGIFCEKNREFLESMMKPSNDIFLQCVREYDGNEEYIHKMPHMQEICLDKSIALDKADPSEFNVLNHGDAWLNNIMFQYDDSGKLQETLFVDFQVSRYGSPAQDLYYFLLSSTQLEIKVDQFDYFIQYYHEQLLEHLALLKSTTAAPTLKEFHCTLQKYGILGYSTIVGVASVCLLEQTEHAKMDSFMAENPDAEVFRKQLYTSDRYKAHAKAVFTWLNRRGLLDQ